MDTMLDKLTKGLEGVVVSTDNEGSTEASSLINEPITPVADPIIPEAVVPVLAGDVDVADPLKTLAADVVVPEITQKTFDELFAEKTGGKYKSWDEVEPLLTPKESEFADEEMRTLNELKKQGVKFDKEFWEIQSKDFASIKDPNEILIESMSRSKDYKGWSKEDLLLELDDKYKRKEWSDAGEEPNEVERLMSKRLLRDAENAREELIKLKESLTIVKAPDTKAIEAQAKAAEEARKNWETMVEDLSGKTTNLSIIVDDKTKETFDYVASDSDRAEAKKIMKELGENPLAVFSQYKNADGSYDNQKVYELLLWIKGRDSALKAAYQNAKAKGAEAEVRGLKNTNFKTDGQTHVPKTKGLADSLKQIYGYKKII